MPIYEYQCSQCSHCFEMIHGGAEKDLKIACPKCGASQPRRILSAFSCGGGKSGESGAASSCSSQPGRFR